MHPVFATLIVAYLWMTLTAIMFYRRGDVPRAVFWLVAIVALAEAVRMFR
jgi:hypothetical protein